DREVHAEGENAFSITVRGRDPETAARAANRLAELYTEGKLQVRAGEVARTRDIITQKLAEMRAELTQGEKKVTAFKRANSEMLPELVDARFHQRDELTKQVELEETFIKEAQRRIDLLGTQPFGKDTEVGRLEELYDTMRARLATLQASLTPDHPDVASMKREVEPTAVRLHTARVRRPFLRAPTASRRCCWRCSERWFWP